MNTRLYTINDVVRNLAPVYQGQVLNAGPVMASLTIDIHLKPISSPPAPAPVAAYIVRHSIALWDDVLDYLRSIRRMYEMAMGSSGYAAYASKIAVIASNRDRVLSLAIPLFVEGQMHAIAESPYKAQQVLMGLLKPIIESADTPLVGPIPSELAPGPANATIVVVLMAGRRPFVLTCHPTKTLQTWSNHLEAATVLVIPQLIVSVTSSLPEPHRSFMNTALAEELRQWQLRRPRIGDNTEWSWLPRVL